MKKSLIIALAMVAPVMAGDEKSAPIAEYVDVPTPTQPAVQSAWGIEVAGTYSAQKLKIDFWDDMYTSETYDVYGTSLTAVYNFDEKSAFTVRFAYGEGDRSDDSWDEVTNYSITAGIRSSVAITDSLSWFVGMEVGYIDTKFDYCGEKYYSNQGVVASIETGLKYNVTENFYIIGTVGVSGVYYTDAYKYYDYDDYNEYVEEADVFGTSINASIGVGYKF